MDQYKYRVVIADMNRENREAIERHIKSKHPDLYVIRSVSSGNRLVEVCDRHQPEIVILNVKLKAKDGLSAAKEVISRGHSPEWIGMADQEHLPVLLGNHELKFADYLMVPWIGERLSKSLGEAVARCGTASGRPFLQEGGGFVNTVKSFYKAKPIEIPERVLVFAQKKDKYVTRLFLSNGKVHHINSTLKDIQSQCTLGVFKAHKSFLVNIKYIEYVVASTQVSGNYDIHLVKNHYGLSIPLSKKMYPNFVRAKEFSNTLMSRILLDGIAY
ncbi:LytR/AlgR family response regulator transcription factor [Paenibacillus sp. S-38]|uniref:LytR/AlgR family response regulator transcription factor n=1 Tax=Paenibacillus sp. S-38 TaxID=3416710 RepID=UPI003CE9C3E8